MKVQFVTSYHASHFQRYGVTVRGNVTSVYPPLCVREGSLERMRRLCVVAAPYSGRLSTVNVLYTDNYRGIKCLDYSLTQLSMR
jgi:hypothetical protein